MEFFSGGGGGKPQTGADGRELGWEAILGHTFRMSLIMTVHFTNTFKQVQAGNSEKMQKTWIETRRFF